MTGVYCNLYPGFTVLCNPHTNIAKEAEPPGGAASPVHRERMTVCMYGRSRAKCRPLIGAADAAVVMATHARVGDPSRGEGGGERAVPGDGR